MENFFGIMKSELLYLKEFESVEHFKLELENYKLIQHETHEGKIKNESGTIPNSFPSCLTEITVSNF